MAKAGRLCCAAVAAAAMTALSVTNSAAAETTRGESTEVSPDQYCVYDLSTKSAQCSAREEVADRIVSRVASDALVKAWGKPNYHGRWIVFHAGTDIRDECAGGGLVAKISNLRDFYRHLPQGQTWNNRISSLKPLNGCAVMLFGRKNLHGANTDWLPYREPRLGRLPTGWNNAATSLLFG